MKLKLCSFKLAKKLKEIGYIPDNPSTEYVPMYYNSNKIQEGQEEDGTIENRFLAPTLELAKMWVRVKHKIHIEIYTYPSGWCWILTKLDGTVIKEMKDSISLKTYEKVSEEALSEVCELIKNGKKT